MTPLTPKRIAELRELISKATHGPWEVDAKEPWDIVVWGQPEGELVFNVGENLVQIGGPAGEYDHANALFIAESRTAMEELLDEVERRPDLLSLLWYCKSCQEPQPVHIDAELPADVCCNECGLVLITLYPSTPTPETV